MAVVHVQLLGEAVDVWRPVEAEPAGNAYRIVGTPPDDERWEFQRGDVVRCETRRFDGLPLLVAVERMRDPNRG